MDEDEYGVAVSVMHSEAPTVTLRLTWVYEQDDERLFKAFADISQRALGISRSLVEEARNG